MFIRQRTLDMARGAHFLVPTISAEARRAHIRATGFARLAEDRARAVSRTLVAAGRYDRAAIMRAAVAAARARQGVTGETWAICMADTLRGTWAVAKRARALTRH